MQKILKNEPIFKGYSIVSCGTLSPELNHLKTIGFLNADRIFYTIPGLHENPRKLKEHLLRQINHAKRYSKKIIVIYGSRCYIDPIDPAESIDRILQEQRGDIVRINAKNCIDMLASAEEIKEIAKGEKIYWLSPGWLKYWKVIFKNWDVGLANETFPRNDKAIVLDGIGFFNKFSQNSPEKLLEIFDWMKIPIESHEISLNRLKEFLIDCVIQNLQKEISELKSNIPPHSIQPSMIQELEDLEEKMNKVRETRDENTRN